MHKIIKEIGSLNNSKMEYLILISIEEVSLKGHANYASTLLIVHGIKTDDAYHEKICIDRKCAGIVRPLSFPEFIL
jgi:hypothetical protein